MYNKKVLIDALKKLGSAKAPTVKKDIIVNPINQMSVSSMKKGGQFLNKTLPKAWDGKTIKAGTNLLTDINKIKTPKSILKAPRTIQQLRMANLMEDFHHPYETVFGPKHTSSLLGDKNNKFSGVYQSPFTAKENFDDIKKEGEELLKKYDREFTSRFGKSEGINAGLADKLIYAGFKESQLLPHIENQFLQNDQFALDYGLVNDISAANKFLGNAYQGEYSKYFNDPKNPFQEYLADKFENVITGTKFNKEAQLRRNSSFNREVPTFRNGILQNIHYNDLVEDDIIYPGHSWSTSSNMDSDWHGNRSSIINIPVGQSGYRPNMFKDTVFSREEEIVLPKKLGYKVLRTNLNDPIRPSPNFMFGIHNPYKDGGALSKFTDGGGDDEGGDTQDYEVLGRSEHNAPAIGDYPEKEVNVKKSNIHGKGLFAEEPIRAGEIIGLSHVKTSYSKDGNEYITSNATPILGAYHNHSEDTNTESIVEGNKRYLKAIRDIQVGEEITADYTSIDDPTLEKPEDFGNDFKNGGSSRSRLNLKYNFGKGGSLPKADGGYAIGLGDKSSITATPFDFRSSYGQIGNYHKNPNYSLTYTNPKLFKKMDAASNALSFTLGRPYNTDAASLTNPTLDFSDNTEWDYNYNGWQDNPAYQNFWQNATGGGNNQSTFDSYQATQNLASLKPKYKKGLPLVADIGYDLVGSAFGSSSSGPFTGTASLHAGYAPESGLYGNFDASMLGVFGRRKHGQKIRPNRYYNEGLTRQGDMAFIPKLNIFNAQIKQRPDYNKVQEDELVRLMKEDAINGTRTARPYAYKMDSQDPFDLSFLSPELTFQAKPFKNFPGVLSATGGLRLNFQGGREREGVPITPNFYGNVRYSIPLGEAKRKISARMPDRRNYQNDEEREETETETETETNGKSTFDEDIQINFDGQGVGKANCRDGYERPCEKCKCQKIKLPTPYTDKRGTHLFGNEPLRFKQGGEQNYINVQLSQKEIDKYIKGGYVVEEVSNALPKAWDGKTIVKTLEGLTKYIPKAAVVKNNILAKTLSNNLNKLISNTDLTIPAISNLNPRLDVSDRSSINKQNDFIPNYGQERYNDYLKELYDSNKSLYDMPLIEFKSTKPTSHYKEFGLSSNKDITAKLFKEKFCLADSECAKTSNAVTSKVFSDITGLPFNANENAHNAWHLEDQMTRHGGKNVSSLKIGDRLLMGNNVNQSTYLPGYTADPSVRHAGFLAGYLPFNGQKVPMVFESGSVSPMFLNPMFDTFTGENSVKKAIRAKQFIGDDFSTSLVDKNIRYAYRDKPSVARYSSPNDEVNSLLNDGEKYREPIKKMHDLTNDEFDELLNSLIGIGAQETKLSATLPGSTLSKAKIKIQDALISAGLSKSVKKILNTKNKAINFLTNDNNSQLPDYPGASYIEMKASQLAQDLNIPFSDAISQIKLNYKKAPKKIISTVEPSKGPFRQKFQTDEGKLAGFENIVEDDLVNGMSQMAENYTKIKNKYPNATPRQLIDLTTLMWNSPGKTMNKELVDFYMFGKGNPNASKFKFDYVSKVNKYKNDLINIHPQSSEDYFEVIRQSVPEIQYEDGGNINYELGGEYKLPRADAGLEILKNANKLKDIISGATKGNLSSKIINKAITPLGYGIVEKVLAAPVTAAFPYKPETYNTKNRYDAWSVYNQIAPEHKGLFVNNDGTVGIKNYEISKEILDIIKDSEKKSFETIDFNNLLSGKQVNFGGVHGNGNILKGKDEEGRQFIDFVDTWDLNPLQNKSYLPSSIQNFEFGKLTGGKPFALRNRIYYDNEGNYFDHDNNALLEQKRNVPEVSYNKKLKKVITNSLAGNYDDNSIAFKDKTFLTTPGITTEEFNNTETDWGKASNKGTINMWLGALGAAGAGAGYKMYSENKNKPRMVLDSKTGKYILDYSNTSKANGIPLSINKEQGGETEYELGSIIEDEETKKYLESIGYTFETI